MGAEDDFGSAFVLSKDGLSIGLLVRDSSTRLLGGRRSGI